MSRKKRKMAELPDEEVIEKLFPKKVVNKIREIIHGKDSGDSGKE